MRNRKSHKRRRRPRTPSFKTVNGAGPPASGFVAQPERWHAGDGETVASFVPPSRVPTAGDARPVLEIEGLEQRLYDPQRDEEFVVYARERIRVPAGSVVAILGPSGCGKTTLLTVLGLLRRPTRPETLARFLIWIDDGGPELREHDVKEAWLRGRSAHVESLRRSAIGFALQSGELLPALNVRENIAAPLRLNGVTGPACWNRVGELLNAFGLLRSGSPSVNGSKLPYSRINKLSGGEYQRVALARAIAHRPTLVFVDEPTAALNRELARGALDQLRTMQLQGKPHGATMMITHDEQLADEFATLVIRMAPMRGRPAGEVVEILERQRPDPTRVRHDHAPCGAVSNSEAIP